MANLSGVSTNYFPTPKEGFITTLGSTILSGASTVPLTTVSGLTNGDIFVGLIEPGQPNEQCFTGVVDTAGSQITSVRWTTGTNIGHNAGVTVVDYVTSTAIAMITKGLLIAHDQDGTLKDNAVATSNITDDAVTAPKVSGLDKSNLTVDSNPYKFSAYRNAAWTTPNTTFGKVTCDTEQFDTNSNFASGTYTVPVDGIYQFQGSVGETATTNGLIRVATIYVNGAEAKRGTEFAATGTVNTTAHVTALVSLTAGQTVGLYTYGNNKAGGTGAVLTWFSGYLVSRT